MFTCQDLIQKRKRIWHERHDISYDRLLVRASVQKILSEPHLSSEVLEKPWLLIEIAFTIVSKDSETVPFFLNDVQADFIRSFERFGPSRPYFILKGRQQGFTSLITAIQLSFSIVRKNFSGFTMAHRADATRAIFNDKGKAVYDRLPDELKPTEKYNNAYELSFSRLESSWRVATADSNTARGMTLNFVHFSEVAFYTCDLSDLQKGIGEAAARGAVIVYETTANGFNQAKDLWDSGSCINLFYEWWRSPEYRSSDHSALYDPDPWLSARLSLLREKGLDEDQLAWYANKYLSYLDKTTIRQEYPCTPDEAFVSSGSCVFGTELVNERLLALSGKPVGTLGSFSYRRVGTPIYASDGSVCDTDWEILDARFEPSSDGLICIHTPPSDRLAYVIGGDTAGSGEDFFTAKVLSLPELHTVATLRVQRISEDLYAEQILCLARYYNGAFIGIEINYSLHPVRVITQKFGYTNFYVRERIDRFSDQPVSVYGFETTKKTKPVIISELVDAFRSDPAMECDPETLKEMLSFVKKDNGSLEASEGKHDDLVMALAIAHFIASQAPRFPLRQTEDHDRFISQNFASPEPSGNTGYMSWDDF